MSQINPFSDMPFSPPVPPDDPCPQLLANLAMAQSSLDRLNSQQRLLTSQISIDSQTARLADPPGPGGDYTTRQCTS